MFSQKLLYRYTYHRIMDEKKEQNYKIKNISSIYYCKCCYKEYNSSKTLFKHTQICEEKDTFLNNQYNCICLNKTYISHETHMKHEEICNDDIISELIIEEDWSKLLDYYERNYVKDLKGDYKKAFDKVNHLRNKDLLILLNKISDESTRFWKYLNDKTNEYPPAYWSNLTLCDFEILN